MSGVFRSCLMPATSTLCFTGISQVKYNFTFLGVQLAPYDQNKKRSLEDITATPVESNWAELREAQVISTKVLPKTGHACCIEDPAGFDEFVIEFLQSHGLMPAGPNP